MASSRADDNAAGASAHTIALESTNPQTDQMRAQVGPVHDFPTSRMARRLGALVSRASAAAAPALSTRPAPSTRGAVAKAINPTQAATFASTGAPRDHAAGATVIA